MRRFKNGLPLAVAVIVATGGVGYGAREHFQAVELSSREQALTRTMGQLEQQMEELTERVNQKEADREEIPAPVKPQPRRIPAVRMIGPERRQDDQKWQRVERLYADEAQKIASAELEVQNAREDLEVKLSSAKDELNDSIARNHDELNALEKKNETKYDVFRIDKLKDFHQIGPVSVSLQKVDTKRHQYNMELIVDQVKLEKKNVNLYEPVYLTLNNWSQPVVLVVNQILKNEIRGYLTLPKYQKSELVSDASYRTAPADSSR
jgi:DNA repair exonuclease SbcCD ATPase subunit